MEQKLRFERFEFKYVLDIETYEYVKRALRHFLELDPALTQRMDAASPKVNFYEVISLYYDSPRFFYYWEKIDGASRRKKIRMRTYRRNGREFSGDIFFEIKRKIDAVILKDRFILNGAELKTYNPKDTHSRRVYEELLFEEKVRVLTPKLLVTYSREPYIGKYNKNVRITFDFGVRAKRTENLFDLDGGFTSVSGTKVIMEVKFKGALPFYIERVLKEYNLSRVPFSKYCLGVEACYSLPLLAMLANKNQSDTLSKNIVNLPAF